MTRDLRYDRGVFALERLETLEPLADRLPPAPMEVRRLGLALAIAGWERNGASSLVQFVADWLYGRWGLLPPRSTPQGAVALLRSLEDDKALSDAIRSALEVEEVLQVAKVLVGAKRKGDR